MRIRLPRAVLSILTASVAVATVAHAQTPTARLPAPAPTPTPTLAPAVIAKPIAISPQLKTALAGKKIYNPSLVQNRLTYTGSVPNLKIAGNKTVALEPVNLTATPKATVSPALRTQLQPYQTYIAGNTIGKAQISKSLQIPVGVDHRSWQTPIKDQGSRGTCVAFASVAGLEWLYKKAYSQTKDLSENHAYNMFMAKEGKSCATSQGIATFNAATYLSAADGRICEESESAYVSTAGSSSCATIPDACKNNVKYGFVSTHTFYAPEYGGTGTEIATNANFLETLVKLGFPVVMGVHVAGSDWSDGTAETGVVDVQITGNGNPAPSVGGHAMTLVGYAENLNYFIFKNSWGTGAGRAGYFYLTYEYLQTYAKYGYVILTATNPG